MFWISVHSATGISGRKVENDRLTVGRSEDSDLVVAHETLSRRHAILQFRDGAIHVEDLGSSNGTFVNGEKIPARRPLRLAAEDEITMGEAHVKIYASTEAPREEEDLLEDEAAPEDEAPALAVVSGPITAPFEKREAPKALREEIETLLSIKATEKSELETLRQSVIDLRERLSEGQRSLEVLEAQRARAGAIEAATLAHASADVTELIESYLKSLNVSREDIVPLVAEVTALMTGDPTPPLVHRWQRLQPRLTGAMAGIALTLAGVGVYKLTLPSAPEEAPIPLRVVAAAPPPAPAPAPVRPTPPTREYRESYVDSVLGSPAFASRYLGTEFQRRLGRELVPKAARAWNVDAGKVQQALVVTAELVKSLADKRPTGAPSAEDLDEMRRLEAEARAQVSEILGQPARYAQLMDLERALYGP